MPEHEAQDRYILKVENIQRQARRQHVDDVPTFCLATYVNAVPTNADSAYGKKQADILLRAQNGDTIACPTEGCDVTVSAEDLKVQDGSCSLASFCLKKAWEGLSEDDEESKKIYQETTDTSDKLRNGFRCPNPLCGLCAGWSEDAIGGTDGICANE